MVQVTQLDAPAPFELWLADLDVEPAEQALGALSLDEHERAARFVFPRDRRRFLAAHVALRQVLAARTGLEPHSLGFVAGPFGKPRLVDPQSCTFSLSHGGDVALIATSPNGEIGVDVEVLRAVEDSLGLAERNFTAAECAELASAARGDRDLVFLRCWTRKEACLKAIGSGLAIAPETFDAGSDPGARAVRIATPAGFASVEVRSIGHTPGIVGALAQVLSAPDRWPC